MTKYKNTAPDITLQDIEESETVMGVFFPDDFKGHYLQYNGGFPAADQFYIEDFDTYISIK